MIDILTIIPEMKSGEALVSALSVLPDYKETIRNQNESIRLIALSDLYRIYIPSPMTTEIYSKLYLALLRSLQKKMTKNAIAQQNQNYRAIQQREYMGIIGGADSFTIIGNSGIGKSSAISRSLSLIQEDGIIEIQNPYARVIPCVVVQCPFDSSVKGLLLEILRKVDECLGSTYYQQSQRVRATTDMLIGSVSQVSLNHIGLLVVDEIQNVVNHKNGKFLVAMLIQLINNSGISICMVGTPECSTFFENALQLARRSLGLRYSSLAYDQYFYDFCCTVFSYQYTKRTTEITDGIVNWLYEHSGGIISVVVSLIHDAQEIAILNGKEILNIETLTEAYQKRLSMLHGYIAPEVRHNNPATTRNRKQPNPLQIQDDIADDFCIAELVAIAKANNSDIVTVLKTYITVEEVAI